MRIVVCVKQTADGELNPFDVCAYEAALQIQGAEVILLSMGPEKAKDFLQRAFTVILLATIVVWFLQSFDLKFNLVTDSGNSILASISSVLVPLFTPVGLGDWRICTALLSGFMAKESVVSVLEILYGTEGGVAVAMTSASAAALLVFSLLYTPCVAAVASIRREMGTKWSIAVILWQCLIAWVAAFVVHLIMTGL